VRPSALIALCTAAAVLGGAAPAAALMFGIADQKPAMFSDPLFASLQIRKARIVVPWDVLSQGWQAQQLDAWMTAAHKAHVRPLVSFGRSRRADMVRRLPTARHLRREFLRLRARYPWVKEWATWNEANHCSQPTCRNPGTVARYYDVLRRACPSCTILAAEVLDQPNMVDWVHAFESHTKVRPRFWGLHNYIDANRMRTSGTRALLSATRGQIWFTETGGIVKRLKKRKIGGFTESPSHAGLATSWVFDRLVPLSSRITRVYLYHWNPGGPKENWDSALISPHGKPRPAFDVLRRELKLVAARAKQAAVAKH
jgi:hypothetical protein